MQVRQRDWTQALRIDCLYDLVLFQQEGCESHSSRGLRTIRGHRSCALLLARTTSKHVHSCRSVGGSSTVTIPFNNCRRRRYHIYLWKWYLLPYPAPFYYRYCSSVHDRL